MLLVVASSGRKGTGMGFDVGMHWWEYALTQPYYRVGTSRSRCGRVRSHTDYGTYLSRTVGEVAPYAAVILLLLALTFVGLWRKPPWAFAACGFS